ncbi:nodulation protein NfeD [Fulvivirga sp. M361]|uniref:NfeD family protein n=1 Tax=Fulvivirga sp. M361 TaxID=2594266 RepID=UPI00117A4381|nr:NfeD family protein [Fulvivirga sp. M361]TRX54356.1 nodulation protein NfeD [Fulvivirga sp. M361]
MLQRLSFLFLMVSMSSSALSQNNVMIMEIRSEIDPRMSRYVELALKHAEEIEADYVIVDMDTYGGIVTDAKDIVERIMEFKKPVWVFINNDAASAGALISIACDSIYMAPGANIGAATVVTGDGEAAPDKYQSYMRSTMRSIAEEKGRNPQIAEAMVDETIEIDSISKSGQVITFSTSEAIKYGFCEAKMNSIEEILERNGVENYELTTYHLSSTDKIIAIFLNPVISGILILVIVGGIWFELQTPGVGFPIAAAVIAAILYFVPYYLTGLAENWEVIIFFVGLLLIAAEVFVIPGFGVAGVLGILFTVSSLVLVMLNNDAFDFSFVPFGTIFKAVIVVMTGMLGSIVLFIIGGAKLATTSAFSRFTLTDTMEKKSGYTSNFRKESQMGKTGTAYTILRPSGKVMIEGELYDAFTGSGYIEKGSNVVVIREEGVSLKVKLSE